MQQISFNFKNAIEDAVSAQYELIKLLKIPVAVVTKTIWGDVNILKPFWFVEHLQRYFARCI